MESSEIGDSRVFISYSHDSAAFIEDNVALADRLNRDGIDTHIDMYEVAPPEGWPAWMEEQIDRATHVLVVCSENYHRRYRNMESPGRGLGATWEGAIIRIELYEQGGRNGKFVPVVFSPTDVDDIPKVLRGATRYDLSRLDGYELLYRRLSNQPQYVKPEIGKVIPFPTRDSASGSSEAVVADQGTTFRTRRELFTEIDRILKENKLIFDTCGPNSLVVRNNPLTDAVTAWNLRKRDTIVPNNSRIVTLLKENQSLLKAEEESSVIRFRIHAWAFADNLETRLSGEAVPTFPEAFRTMVQRALREEQFSG